MTAAGNPAVTGPGERSGTGDRYGPPVRRGKKKKAAGRWLFLLAALEPGVFLLEFLDTAGGVDEFLLAGEEGVTLGANFYFYILLGRPNFNLITTGTSSCGHTILGMYFFFHFLFSPHFKGYCLFYYDV